ncbi:TPA: hypothetical protein ACH3X1_008801 [Trebouxia sp. C0004]
MRLPTEEERFQSQSGYCVGANQELVQSVSEEHLQLHEQEIVSQARQAEVVHTTSAMGGLPAESSSHCQQPLQLQPPRDNQATRKGHGRGAADGTR